MVIPDAELVSDDDEHDDDTTSPAGETFVARYTAKDVIQYALSIGYAADEAAASKRGGRSISHRRRHSNNDDNFGNYNRDLKYVYERHDDFAVVPAFCLTLPFFAVRQPRQRRRQCDGGNDNAEPPIPSFPPPIMRQTGIIPRRCLKKDKKDPISLDEFPVLHTFQSITWHRDLAVPSSWDGADEDAQTATRPLRQSVRLSRKFVSVVPKSLGTFVTTETSVQQRGCRICTLRSTELVLGIPPDWVVPMGNAEKHQQPTNINEQSRAVLSRGDNDTPFATATFEAASNTALLYRMASGDSNPIHVVGTTTSESKSFSSCSSEGGRRSGRGGASPPIAHGLWTFAVVSRLLVNVVDAGSGGVGTTKAAVVEAQATAIPTLVHMEGRFAKPVLLGTRLILQVWDASGGGNSGDRRRRLFFVVRNAETDDCVMDRGYAELIEGTAPVNEPRSRL